MPCGWVRSTPMSDDAEPPAEDLDAAASALARARAAARAKGLRPGLKPLRRRPREVPADARSRDDARDPQLLGDQMEHLLADRGWKVDVAVGSVMGRWPEIVGPEMAQHCAPVTFEAGVLTVRADSTAWATQIRLLASSLLARLEGEVGPGTVTELRVVGPSAPSWSRGPRRVSDGRGPRDTYG
jgi:predicted nucleic acid-binding Zn ribbon protein